MNTSLRVLLLLSSSGLVHCTADLARAPDAVECADRAAARSNASRSQLDRERKGVVLLMDGRSERKHDRRYEMAFGAVGFAPTRVDRGELAALDLEGLRVLIVPAELASGLSRESAQRIAREVERGLSLYTEAPSTLATLLGVSFEGPAASVQAVRDEAHPEIAIQWAEPADVLRLDAAEMRVHARAGADDRPILVSGALGAGRWLVSAIALDAPDGFGYGRLPYFHEALLAAFELTPLLSRPHLITYLDWGAVYDEDPHEVAERLAKRGVSQVHLSGWYRLERTRYFFEPFIAACHAHGVLVFAWLELPMVSTDFWDEHPECRQRTAVGTDAEVDWRKLIALEDPACMKAAKRELRELLTALPWDGVDVAELYFETPRGFDFPELFTPMSDWARMHYQAEAGIDPVDFFAPDSPNYRERVPEDFQAYLAYRNALCLEQNREVIEFVRGLRIGPHARPPSVMVTLIDTLIDTYMGDYIGIDLDQFIGLQAELDFDLNIEDPYTLWAKGPDRYRLIGQHYREALGPKPRLSVDINIVDRGDTVVPHVRQTGLEFLTLLYESAQFLDQTCVYSAYTPYEFDFEYAAVALAGSARAHASGRDRFEVDAPFSVRLHTDTRGHEIRLDGERWPCAAAQHVLVPAGQHTIELEESEHRPDALRITAVNGEIQLCEYRDGSVALRYDERRPVLVTLDRAVDRVELDGKQADYPTSNRCAEAHTVSLPAGRHTVLFSAE
jgi:hypothetical protein